MPTQPTVARPNNASGSSHWYSLDGQAQHEVKKKDGGGMRATTLADARKNNWIPSVTSILKVIDKPALNDWRVEQAVLAVVTAKRNEGETDDAFVQRVLHVEKQQEEEGRIAREKGTEIHDALEGYFSGLEVPAELEEWIRPVLDHLMQYGDKASSEIILVGDDYAGCADLLQDCGEWWRLWDFKATKSIPDPNKGAWLEHRLQLAAYAMAFQNKLKRAGQVKPILVGNVYISSINKGQFVAIEHENWEEAYTDGFAPLVRHWQYVKQYKPLNPTRDTLQKAQGDVTAHYQVENAKLRREIEDLRAKLAVAAQNAPPPAAAAQATAVAAAEEVTEPERSEGAPEVLPESVKELVKSGKRVAWSSSTAAPPVAQATPLPVPTGPGRPSPLVQKEPPTPPGVTPRRLVNGPNGPVMQ